MSLLEQDGKTVFFRPQDLSAQELLSQFTSLLSRITELVSEGYVLTNNPFQEPTSLSGHEFKFLLEKPPQQIELDLYGSQTDTLLTPLQSFIDKAFQAGQITSYTNNALCDLVKSFTRMHGRRPRIGDLVFHKKFRIYGIRRFGDAGRNQINKLLTPLRLEIGMKSDSLFTHYTKILEAQTDNDA